MELKIYEGEEKKDVTFSHNANFFLFTTLEPARKIAHGRVPQPQTMAPVLTGAPVAGMVYLDRPNPAGYFIFPDLSVRHEGQYRLSFSLFEDVKEDKDSDNKSTCGPKKLGSGAMAPRAHVHFRLEVKSVPFFVFSAKKFPGLSESTMLSRQVAEQGCRVRIRRDIRVRRRDNKAIEGYMVNGEENHHASSERYSTPQQLPDRPRSISNGSVDTQTPYTLQRRPSMEMPAYYPPAYPQQSTPASANSTTSNHSASYSINGSNNTNYQQKGIMSAPLPLPPPPPQQYPVPDNNPQYTSSFHTRQLSAPHNYGYQQAPQSQMSYSHPQTYKQEYQPAMETSRRASVNSSLDHEPRQMHDSYSSSHSMHQQQNLVTTSINREARSLTPINTKMHNSPNTLPPLTSVFPGPPIDQPASPASDTSGMPRGPQNPYSKSMSLSNITHSSITPQSSTSSYSPFPPSSYSATTDPLSRLSKRPYATTFDTSHFNAPQHSGMRPDPNNQARDIQKIETDDGELQDLYSNVPEQLTYRRANGTLQAKHCQTRSPPKSHS